VIICKRAKPNLAAHKRGYSKLASKDSQTLMLIYKRTGRQCSFQGRG
jgi:hypothetical protein